MASNFDFFKYLIESRNIKVLNSDVDIVDERLKRADATGLVIDSPDLDRPIVMYKRQRKKDTRLFTIAHELGHIIAGHVTPEGFGRNVSTDQKELEASIIGAVIFGISLYDEYKKNDGV